jgi:hypothetical protein
VTERGRDNLRIAIKVLALFATGLGILFLVHLAGVVYPSREPIDIYPSRPSTGQVALSVVYVGLFFLTFLVPVLVLRRELQKRRKPKGWK